MVHRYIAANALLLFSLASGQPPVPTPDQVAWLDREVGALFQFNIGEYGTVSALYHSSPFCLVHHHSPAFTE